MNLEKILSKKELSTYKSVRAIAVLLTIYCGILSIGIIPCIVILLFQKPEGYLIAVPILLVLTPVVILGLIGAIAILQKNGRRSKLVLGMAVVLLGGFPIGTIIGGYLLLRLNDYCKILEFLLNPVPIPPVIDNNNPKNN